MSGNKLRTMLAALLMMVTGVAQAQSLAGVWTGFFESGGQRGSPTTIRFAPGGYPIFEYDTRTGKRFEVIQKVGQSWSMQDTRGGTTNVQVLALSVGPGTVSYSVALRHERVDSGNQVQEKASIAAGYRFVGAVLTASLDVESTSTVTTQAGAVVAGNPVRSKVTGSFRQAR